MVFIVLSANITDVANSLPIDILDISGDNIDGMIKQYLYFAKGMILKGTLI
ncbi:hypothetical protein [Campylobacter pinnipediorum]|uniref:hypothetical protein n=1 Tax=Campylobacter pinnipediorum TaxID=1965231 RepID=UPI00214CC058|nr:hypothetical protein [Campylobacter pinnipediorum]